MTMGRQLLEVMLEDGVSVPSEERDKVIIALDKAINDKKIYWIGNRQGIIGFATYKDKVDKIFLDYCFIYKEFRDRCNLLSLRKFFREIHDNFAWKSRKRNRLCFVK